MALSHIRCNEPERFTPATDKCRREGDMKRVLVCAAVLFVSSCGDSDDGSWKPYDQRSYNAGYEAGMIGTCNRIHRYKESVGKALIEEKICPFQR